MRVTAVARSLNFFNGFAPGRVFQISTNREAGQFSASFASVASLLKRSESGTASASFAEAWTVMLLVSFSIVKVFILNLLVRCLPRSGHSSLSLETQASELVQKFDNRQIGWTAIKSLAPGGYSFAICAERGANLRSSLPKLR